MTITIHDMIIITIEIIPFGDLEKKKVIGKLTLWNDGSGNVTIGNYEWIYNKKNKDQTCLYSGTVKQFNQSRGMGSLLKKILTQIEKQKKINDQ